MEVRVETRALQQLEKALRESGRGVKLLATGIMRGTFEKLIQNARNRLVANGGMATGELIKGIKLLEFNGFDSPTKLIGRYGATEEGVKHTSGSYIRETISDSNSYAFYVEMGRGAGAKQPPAKDIARWLSQRKWQFYYYNKGKKEYTEFRNLPTHNQYLVAKAVAKAISTKGIKARRFMFGDSAGNLHTVDLEIIDNDLNNLAERIANRLAHSEEG